LVRRENRASAKWKRQRPNPRELRQNRGVRPILSMSLRWHDKRGDGIGNLAYVKIEKMA
jgi:hypothetical protein